MGYYIISLAVFTLCCVAGYGLYRSHKFENKMANRMDLVVRASHTCASRMNSACEKLDSMQIERKINSDYQRKVGEHQRVLLASLNRQIQQLDAQLSAGPATWRSDAGSKVSVNTAPPPLARESKLRSSVGHAIGEAGKITKSGGGMVRLEELFRTLETNDELVGDNASQVENDHLPVTLPAIETDVEPRRVAHG